jgi:catechol 2,3-dioxygenase-like lactoylglutathione lyase family enzyme
MLEVQAYIEVTEPERGIAFYCEGLGLTVRRRLSPRWIELAGANLPLFLLANRPDVADLGTTRAKRDYSRHWSPVHLDFIVSDLDAMVARLTARRHA